MVLEAALSLIVVGSLKLTALGLALAWKARYQI